MVSVACCCVGPCGCVMLTSRLLSHDAMPRIRYIYAARCTTGTYVMVV